MQCRIAVGIPTVGRAPILADTLRELGRQTRPADRVVVCGASEADMAGAAAAFPGVTLLLSQAGLPRQRNAILSELADAEIVVFFDDDFLPSPTYLDTVERHMTQDSGIVVSTGCVLADGIGGPGLTPEQARAILSQDADRCDAVVPTFSGYGCNMAVRASAMRDKDILFDERLPLYGWQEDVDVSRRLSSWGRVVQLTAARGVHLGAKTGRGSGIRLGYSQVANPLYLAGKRAGYPFGRALSHMACNIAMNIARSPWPESYLDRRGRLRGNILAVQHLMSGRLAPERALEL